MKTIFLLLLTFASQRILHSQSNFFPDGSMALGIEDIQAAGDSIFIWRAEKGALLGGFYLDTDFDIDSIGEYSLAYGANNMAMGNSSVALGWNNRAEDVLTFVFGMDNIGRHAGEMIVGYNNRVAEQSEEPIFSVGNGISPFGSDRSNAFIVTEDDGVGIGNIYPDADLHIEHGDNGQEDGIKIQNVEGSSTWRFFAGNANPTDQLALFHSSVSPAPVGVFDISGTYGAPSDARLKTDISNLPYGLETVLALEPKKYRFKHIKDPNKSNLGFIAQEAIKVVPELVQYNQEEDTYHMYYDGFAVIAIQAIKELKEIIDEQQKDINELRELLTRE